MVTSVHFIPGDSEHDKQINETLDSPMAAFRGCVDGSEASAKALHCYPAGDELQPPRLSWVLQVGGYVSPFQMEMPQGERP